MEIRKKDLSEFNFSSQSKYYDVYEEIKTLEKGEAIEVNGVMVSNIRSAINQKFGSRKYKVKKGNNSHEVVIFHYPTNDSE